MDKSETVMGYVNLRIEGRSTNIKVGHNYNEQNIILSLSSNSGTNAFSLGNNEEEFILDERIDATREIFAILIKREGGEIVSLASGIVNMEQKIVGGELNNTIQSGERIIEQFVPKSNAKEIDDLLRSVCSQNVHDIHNCKNCPYRMDFFEIKQGG